MRILLDSRDLINIAEHSRPITAENLEAYLRARNHEIVLSFTNVRELSGPLAAGVEFMDTALPPEAGAHAACLPQGNNDYSERNPSSSHGVC